MKKILIGVLGIVLTGGLAVAQQETTQEEVYGDDVSQPTEQQDPMTQTEPETEDPTQTPTEAEDPMMGEEAPAEESSTWEQDSGMQHSVADLGVEELQGMTVVTETGEELGTIDRVGHSEEHQVRVVTVDVGGFLGVAEKTIAIPVSELEMTPDGHVQTTLTKESIEAHEEFDEQGFTEEEAETEMQTETPETDY